MLRLNHIGDWGTQFGMLIQHMNERKEQGLELEGESEGEEISDLQKLYRYAHSPPASPLNLFPGQPRSALMKMRNSRHVPGSR